MDYYIYKNETNVGPISEREVIDGIRSRKFLLTDLGCRVGETEWKDISFFFPLETQPPAQSTQPLYPPQNVSAPLPQQPAYQQPSYQLPSFQQPSGQTQPLGNNPYGQGYSQPGHSPYQQNQIQPINYAAAGNPYSTGNYQLGPRFLGLLIDGLIAIPLAIMAAFPFVGLIGAPLLCLYFISRDAIFGGQSIGKRVMGLRVIKSDGSPFTWADSVRRNIVYFPMLFLMIPWIGHILHTIVAGPLGLVELILILSGGQRMGDRMGQTYVVKC